MSTELKEKLITLLEERFDDMRKFDFEFGMIIAGQGWHMYENFAVPGLSNGRRWRVNYLITTQTGARCAIELDNRSPRKRSLMKLRELPEGMTGFVLLRNGKYPVRYTAGGVDVVRAARFKY